MVDTLRYQRGTLTALRLRGWMLEHLATQYPDEPQLTSRVTRFIQRTAERAGLSPTQARALRASLGATQAKSLDALLAAHLPAPAQPYFQELNEALKACKLPNPERADEKTARALLQATVLQMGAPRFSQRELRPLQSLPPQANLLVALAICPAIRRAPQMSRALLTATCASLRAMREAWVDDPLDFLSKQALRLTDYASGLNIHLQNWAQVEKLAVRLAELDPVQQERKLLGTRLGHYVALIQKALPGTSIPIKNGSDDRPGLITLAKRAGRLRFPPEELLPPVLAAIALANAPALVKARFAIEVALALSISDGDPQTAVQKLIEDLEKLEDLAPLFRLPAGMPAELAPTALRLSKDDQDWLLEELRSLRSRDAKRALRDFIFAEQGLLKSYRAAPPRVRRSVARYVAGAYREARLTQLDWSALKAGLDRGADPVPAILTRSVFKLAQAAGLPAQDADSKTLQSCVTPLMDCLLYLEHRAKHPAGPDQQVPYQDLLDALKKLISQAALGQWPKARYIGANYPGVDPRVFQSPIRVRKDAPLEPEGLRAALEPIASLDASALGRARDEALNALRKCRKGEARHRALVQKLRDCCDRLNLLELHARVQTPGLNDLSDLYPSLRRLDLQGVLESAHAIDRIREDAFVEDSDSLEALFGSHHTGCLNPKDGFRRWALVSAACDPSFRILRVFREGRLACRAYLRLLKVKFAGYTGPALWVEDPVGETTKDIRLLYRGAIAKALAMGVPVLGETGFDSLLRREGLKLGREGALNLNVAFQIKLGPVPVQHSDALFEGLIMGTKGQVINFERRVRSIVI